MRLGLDYVDIFQCHDIDFVSLDQIVEEALPTLRRLQEQGKTRFVGITGFPCLRTSEHQGDTCGP